MRQQQDSLDVATGGKGLYDVTREVAESVAKSGISLGLTTVFLGHTSASLLIQENADQEVQRDLERFFSLLVPEGDPLFLHVDEGPDDMPAHVRAALTQTSIAIPVRDGKLALGTWQGLYVYEHRNRPYRRTLLVHTLGE